VVAHFNHGIRSESLKDEQLVSKTAKKYGLSYEIGHGCLGPNASEELARKERYKFLHSVAKKYQADGIITAHHQDDLIETAFINILRGTGPRGLAAISSNPNVLRPLLNTSKKKLISYAATQKLKWNDDATNANTKYARNYIRLRLMPKLSIKERQELLKTIDKIADLQKSKDMLIATISHNVMQGNKINRDKFRSLPSEIGNDIVVRTARPGTIHNVKKDMNVHIGAKTAGLVKTA
jgi:tRNA(Ile)-lysidine synthase